MTVNTRRRQSEDLKNKSNKSDIENDKNQTELDSNPFRSYVRQSFCVVVMTACMYILAFNASSTSMLPSILHINETEPTDASVDLKWLASAPILAGVPGNFMAFYFSDVFGPRLVYRWCLSLSVISSLLLGFHPTFAIAAATRVAQFLISGICEVIMMPMIAELSEPKARGMLSHIPDIAFSFGVLFTFLCFSLMDSKLAIIVSCILPILGFLGTFFVPESPYWLLSKGDEEAALSSIKRVIGNHRKAKVQQLLDETKQRVKENENNSAIKQIPLMKKPKNWKPLLLVMTTFYIREFSGQSMLLYYTLPLFEKSGIQINVFLCTIIFSIVRMLSSFLGGTVEDCLGRRSIFMGSLSIASVTLLVTGSILYFEIESLRLVPVIGLFVFTFTIGAGIGPVPFVLIGEFIPSEVKFLCTAIIITCFYAFQFTVVNIVPNLLQLIGFGPVLLVFAGVNCVNVVITYFILPESKNKSLIELENIFK